MNEEFKLCYVKDNFAYFTTQNLDEQWGDDWDDAPYEHNAGCPYYPTNKESWKILKVAFDSVGTLSQPKEFNDEISVIQINKGIVPWLSDSYSGLVIYAGCTIKEFEQLIAKMSGNVYWQNGKQCMHFVTVMYLPYEYLDEQPTKQLKGWDSHLYKRIRCCGWYSEYEKAKQCVLNNLGDIYENGYYNIALIESVNESVYPRSKVSWFAAEPVFDSDGCIKRNDSNNSMYSVTEIDKPPRFKTVDGVWSLV